MERDMVKGPHSPVARDRGVKGLEIHVADRVFQTGELVHGVFLAETRKELLAIVGRLREKTGIQGLIMGGTELPLILRDVDDRGIPFLDTTRIHAEDAVARMLM